MSDKPRVYLAGPINGLTYDEATGWRGEATDRLGAMGIQAYSPMRSKGFLKQAPDLTWKPGMYDDPFGTSKGIQCRDYNDCVNADLILMNLAGIEKASIGTCFELAWAYEHRIPVVLIAESGNLHVVHPMAAEMINFRVDTLDQALAIVKSVLLPWAVA